MIVSQNKRAQLLTGKYPFLKNFPFKEFSVEVGEFRSAGMVAADFDFDGDGQSPTLVRFNTEDKILGKAGIVVFETELQWVANLSDKISELDGIRKTLDRGLRSRNIIVKRDAVDAAELWCKGLEDNHSRLSYSTVGESLMQMIGDRGQLTRIISKIVALSKKKGLVNLTKEEHDIIMAHYHFQLIYTKLILGLVIASKISI